MAGTAHPEVIYRVNAGGALITSTDSGPDWAADPDSNPTLRDNGTMSALTNDTITTDSTVPASTPAAIFQAERYDNGVSGDGAEMLWHFPVQSGNQVKVRLYFINHYPGTSTVGSRVFDVSLEGTTVLPNFDIIAAAGGTLRGTMREFSTTSNGNITIGFTHHNGLDNPLINGIEIISLAPLAPATPTATAGVTSATVSWSTPAANGSAISGYVITPYKAGVAQTPTSYDASTTTRTLTGLTAGSAYTFTVAAVSSGGTGSASPQSAAVTPYGVPGAPTIGAVTGGSNSAVVNWTAPSSNGGSAVTGYVVTPYIGTTAQAAQTFASTALSQTVTGLTGGVVYTFAVAATNAAGTGPQSARSVAVTTTGTPPLGEVGVAYSYQFTGTGGTAPYTYSVSAGTLPPGLTLNTSTGLVSGTPTTAGSSTFSVAVRDSLGATGSRSITVQISAAPVISGAPTTGTVSGAYSYAMVLSGGNSPYGWSVSSGTLPAGIRLSASTGQLSGIPTTAGSYSFTVMVSDASGGTATKAVTLLVNAAPVISGTPTAGTVGATYSYAMTVSGGVASYSWSVSAGTLPAGVTLNSGTGVLSGTPTTAGTSSFTVQVSDGNGVTASKAVTVSVNGAPVVSGTPTSGEVSVAYSHQMSVTGGTSPYAWSISAGALPAGVMLAASTGLLSGTPTASGTASFTVRVADANGVAATSAVSLVVKSAPSFAGTLPPGGTVGTPYSFQLVGTGGTTPYTWASSAMAPGLTLNTATGVISGTPTTAGSVTSTITLTDALGATASAQGTLIIAAAMVVSGTPPTGEVAVAYSYQMTVSGGTPPITWSVSSGTLPAGVTLGASTGLLSGTPTAAGSYPFTVLATDGARATATRSVTLVVAAAPVVSGTPTTATLGAAYSYPMTVAGGLSPYTWSVSAGALPGGVTLNTSTGVLSGAPSTAGTYSLTVQAVDANNVAATRSVTLTVNAAPVVSGTPPTGEVSVAYSYQMTVSSGTSPYTWSVSTGSLPPGLTFGTATGQLSGTPTAAGSYPFTVQVSDANGATSSQAVTLIVNAAPVVAGTPTAGEVSVAYSFQMAVTGGSAPYAWSLVAGTLPAGVSLGSTTGLLSGTPTSAGSYPVTVRVSDAAGVVATRAVTLVVTAVPVVTGTPGAAEVSAPYSYAMTVTGGTSPYTWSVTSGALPAGITLGASSGVLSGTSSAAGSYPLTVQVTDAAGVSATRSVTLVVTAAPIVTGTPSAGELGVAYSYPMAVSGGTSPYAWSLSAGALPSGVTLSASTGLLSGTPSTAGSYSFTLRVLDAAGVAATRAVTLVVNTAVAVSGTPPTGEVSLAYSYQMTVTGGTAPVAWSVSAGSLPSGVTLSSSTGLLSGTPTTAGSYPFTVRVSDASGGAATTSVTLAVTAAPVVSGTPQTGEVSLAYSYQMSVAGGTAPYAWSLSSGSLPPGVTLSASTGLRSGTPTAAGSYPFTVQVSDASAVTATRAGTLVVNAALTLTGTPPTAEVSLAYSYQMTATGGIAPLAWALSTGTLPAGVTLNASTGVLSGTPTAAGSYPFTVQVSDSAGAVATRAVTLAVTAAPVVSGTPTTGEVSLAYSYQMSVVGGTAPYAWTLSAGSLPPGVSLGSSTGLLSGTPTAAGSFSFTVQVSDASAVTATRAVTLAVTPAPALTFAAAPAGEVAVAYTTTLTATGGTSPLTWSISAGSVPAGLTLNTSTGVLSGAPTAGATSSFTVKVVDANGVSATRTASIVIAALPTLTSVPPAPQQGVGYSFPFAATGGTGPFTYALLSGALPPGFTLSSAGVLSGTTQPLGSYTFTVRVSDSYGKTADDLVTMTIAQPPISIVKTANVTSVAPGGTVTYSVTLTNTSGTTYNGIQLTDPQPDVVDDATYSGNTTVSSGSVAYSSSNLVWSVDAPAHSTATMTYSVVVANPGTGNKVLTGTISTSFVSSTCNPGYQHAECTAPVTVSVLSIAKTADVATTTPGSVVHYTITVTNSGQTPFAPAAVSDALSGVLDDALYNNDAAASTGSATYASSTVSWSGALAPGAVATITYSVTVRSPEPGDKSMTDTVTSATAGSTCPAAGPAAACTSTVGVLLPGLTITNTLNVASTTPGSTLRFTVTATNNGQTAQNGVSFTVDASGVFDDATPIRGSVTTSTGTLTYPAGTSTIVWNGSLAVGAAVTVTGLVTVSDPDNGDHSIETLVTSTAPGNNCAVGSTDAGCSSIVPVYIPALSITKTADVSTTTPASVVHYTVTVTNSGQTPYTGASFSDSLSGVLDDAAYGGGVTATSGTVSYTAPTLSWTGDLPIGAIATISYAVTVASPDTGDRSLTNTVISSTQGSTCRSGSTDTRCTSTVAVLIPGLSISAAADAATATPGDVVHYTLRFADTGQTAYTGASVSLDTTNVLDDATYNGDATTSSGSLALSGGTLTWTGDIAVAGVVTVTISVTVKNPDTGNKSLAFTLTSSTPGSSCPVGNSTPACWAMTSVLVPQLTIVKTADVATTTPGSTVHYTITVTNSGQTSYAAASFSDSLASVLPDATYNGDASPTSGTVSYASSTLSWTGALAIGASATVTYSVTVPDPDLGGKRLLNTVVSSSAGSTCPAGGSDSRCTAQVIVLVPALTIVKTADATTTTPGSTVHYTVTATNTGQTPYSAATFADSLTGVLDDATYNANASATTGTASYSSGALNWTGALAPGNAVTVTYSVTVNQPAAGNALLTSVVSSTTAGTNCASGSSDARCASSIAVQQLLISQAYTVATTTPGSVVHLVGTFTNTGKVPYTSITIGSPSANTVDDAVPNGDQAATSGTLVLSSTAITWTGDIAPGATVTITGSLTVKNPDTGDKLITGTLSSTAPGNNCPSGGTDPRCTAVLNVLLPGLTVSTTASTRAVVPGGTVGYTVLIRNTGQTAYTAAHVTDTLQLLDDADYNNDATATAGALAYTQPDLGWTGDLAAGATVTVTFSVTTHDPDTGDRIMINRLVSAETGTNCPVGSSDSRCSVTSIVLNPALTITKTASASTAVPGSRVTYTIVAANTGQVAFPAASFSDPLAGALDDGTYDSTATTTSSGTTSYSGSTLSWTGSLAPGDSATIRYVVVVANPDVGDRSVTSTIVSSVASSNCTASPDSRCTAAVMVTDATSLTFTKTSLAPSAPVGGVVHYTVTVANTGLSDYSGATFTDPLTGVLDDATYDNNAAATAGTPSYAASTISWTGTVPASSSVTVTYSVTVSTPTTGDLILSNTLTSTSSGSNCLAGNTDPRCSARVTVSQLTITPGWASPTTTPGSTLPGGTTFTNTGTTPFVGISVVSNGSDVVDDAVPTGDETASSGTLSLANPNAVWTGNIAPGQTVTISASFVILNPDNGDQRLTTKWTSETEGSSCPAATIDPACTATATVLTPGLTITKTGNTPYTVPGGSVTYTTTIRNTGQTAYVGATVTDSLTGVLDDGVYNANATATAGSLSYTSPVLTWTGNLAVAATVTISYSVTVRSPDPADKLLSSTVASTDAGSTCQPASGASGCSVTTAVLTPILNISETASTATTTPGATVTHTVTVTNSGQTSYSSATFAANLTGALDDGAYSPAATTVSSGSVAISGNLLTWTSAGAFAVGQVATITYAVVVANPDTGDHLVNSAITSTNTGATCPVGNSLNACRTSVPVGVLSIQNSPDVTTILPGGALHLTTTITNTGQTAYTGITLHLDLADALDDSGYNTGAHTTSGDLSFAGTVLTWSGSVPVGGTVSITDTAVIDNPDTGNHVIYIPGASDAPGSTCPAGAANPPCALTVTVLHPGLTITKTADASTATPGEVVHYTVSVADTGESSYTGAVVTDSLASLLTDATYDGNVSATRGGVAYSRSTLTWTGDLTPGSSATITYSVTINSPDLGDKRIINSVVSDELGSSCPTGSSNAACTSSLTILVPALAIHTAANVTTTTPGATVNYTVTVTNTGQTAYTGATVTDQLAGLLDDATYNGDVAASLGAPVVSGGVLTWTGDLAVAAVATITYSVTVRSPDPGDKAMTNGAASTAAGANCPTAGSDPTCSTTVTVLIPGLSFAMSADYATATPGDQVEFTATVTNTGQTPYASASLSAALTGFLDDGTYANDATTSGGQVSVTGSTLSWNGAMAVGAVVTITYSVVVASPDAGDKSLRTSVTSSDPGSTCPVGNGNAGCAVAVAVLVPSLHIAKVASVSRVAPGGSITYTVTVTNDGQTAYPAATFTDSLSDVLNDATFDGQATSSVGGTSYSAPNLTWTGSLDVGASATVSYTVRVLDPDPGDKSLSNTVTSSSRANNCPVGGTAAACTTIVRVTVPALLITKTINHTVVTAGSAATYTVTVANVGETAYTGASFSDSLTGVLDDATYNRNATATSGTLSYAASTLGWSGNLALGATATITYSVTTVLPAVGDRSLDNTVVSTTVGNNCPSGSTDARCRVVAQVLIPQLTITKTADTTTVVSGGVVHYTIVATNTGQAAYVNVILIDAMGDVLDDATYSTVPTATSGTITRQNSTLQWNGPLPVGAGVTISYAVRVDHPDTRGNQTLSNSVSVTKPGSTCPVASPNPSCSVTMAVQETSITITDLAPSFTLSGAPGSTAEQDGAVTMTVTTNNPGGYNVSVQAKSPTLTDQLGGVTDAIPIPSLLVRETGTTVFVPLSSTAPVIGHMQSTPSGPGGDAVSNDYQLTVPFVASGMYSASLDYIATAP